MRKRRFFEQHDSKSDLIYDAKEAFDFLVEEVIGRDIRQEGYNCLFLPRDCHTEIGLWVVDDNTLGLEFGECNWFFVDPDGFDYRTREALKSAETEEDALGIVDEDFSRDVNDLVESTSVYEEIELPVSKKELEEELWRVVEQHRACEEKISGTYHNSAMLLWKSFGR